jgi:hypothetical protein
MLNLLGQPALFAVKLFPRTVPVRYTIEPHDASTFRTFLIEITSVAVKVVKRHDCP